MSSWNPWMQYEERFLREAASKMTAAQIAEKLERTERAVFAMASRLRIKLTSASTLREWTDDEAEMFDGMSVEEIAAATGRTIYSVRAKRYKLNLEKSL